MGRAEQRQVRSGTAGRLRERGDRGTGTEGRLGEIRRRRTELDDAARRTREHETGLRAAVGLALLDPEPPEDAEIARAAGWTLDEVRAHRTRLGARPPG